MSNRLAKLRRLAQILTRKTELGELRWQRSASVHSFQTAFPDSAIIIDRREIFDPKPVSSYRMQVLNSGADVVETLVGYDGVEPTMPDLEPGARGNAQLLLNLYEAAARSANTADPTVDRLPERLGV